MGALLTRVLPLAFGAAVSPTLFALEVLVLSGERQPVKRAWAVAGGATVVLAAYSVLGLTLLVNFGTHHHHSVLGATIDLGAAFLLLVLAARSLIRRPTAAESRSKRRSAKLADASTISFAGIGMVAMLVNFSTLVLFLPALHFISESTVSLGAKLTVGVVLVVITLLPAWIPPALVAAVGPRADPFLSRLNGFVAGHSREIGAGIEILFFVVLLWKGIGQLS
jgi:hypothetical protein